MGANVEPYNLAWKKVDVKFKKMVMMMMMKFQGQIDPHSVNWLKVNVLMSKENIWSDDLDFADQSAAIAQLAIDSSSSSSSPRSTPGSSPHSSPPQIRRRKSRLSLDHQDSGSILSHTQSTKSSKDAQWNETFRMWAAISIHYNRNLKCSSFMNSPETVFQSIRFHNCLHQYVKECMHL